MNPSLTLEPNVEPVLEELRLWLCQSLRGRGRMIFLIGDDREERQRTMDEIESFATDVGMLTSRVDCTASEGPYGFWRLVVEELLGATEAEGAVLDLGRRAQLELTRAVGCVAEDFALFDVTAVFLTEMSMARPVALTLVDLSSADLPSLRMLTFVARAIHRSPVFILGTVSEAVGEEAAQLLCGELARESRRLNLAPTS